MNSEFSKYTYEQLQEELERREAAAAAAIATARAREKEERKRFLASKKAEFGEEIKQLALPETFRLNLAVDFTIYRSSTIQEDYYGEMVVFDKSFTAKVVEATCDGNAFRPAHIKQIQRLADNICDEIYEVLPLNKEQERARAAILKKLKKVIEEG